MSDLKLSLAMGNYDRTRAILDGRVKIDGVDPVPMLLSPEEMFFRAFRHQAFDISELSLSSYSISVARGNPHYVAIPVFLSRAFRHTSVYIRTDKGINKPEDLKGRRIGIAEYQLSANVWVRGGMDTPGRPEKIKVDLPSDLTIEEAPAGSTLNGMLAAGEIDGFIGPRWPRCFAERHPHVGRLFADSIGAAEDFYRRTRVFPIMHVLGVRRSLAEEFPFLPAALFKAFNESKRLAQDALADTSATKVTMPFVEDTLNRAHALMGDDPWSYGVQGNAHVLNKFLDYHAAQGLSPRRVQIEELFHPSTLEAYSL